MDKIIVAVIVIYAIWYLYRKISLNIKNAEKGDCCGSCDGYKKNNSDCMSDEREYQTTFSYIRSSDNINK